MSFDDAISAADRAGPPNVFDFDSKPAPLLCRRCSRTVEWEWFKGRGVVRPRWCPPRVTPCCKRCETQEAIDNSRAEMNRRQAAAGIAPTHRSYSLDFIDYQRDREPWEDFARRISLTKGWLGVAKADAPALALLDGWQPSDGGIYLHGPPGAGKTLWVSALLSRLIAPTEGGESFLAVEELVARGIGYQQAVRAVESGLNRAVKPAGLQLQEALLIDEEEVVHRVGLSWKGDQVPLLKIAKVGLLAYDDMGTVLLGSVSPKAAELSRVCVARMIDLRWREELPTIVTSNRSFDDMRNAVDRKTADRMSQMFPNIVELAGIPAAAVARGWSWRNLPPPT